jgi:hypothetical protein
MWKALLSNIGSESNHFVSRLKDSRLMNKIHEEGYFVNPLMAQMGLYGNHRD